ncbi:uncharacterized protein TNCV_2336031 [Trichonephila clavipes]|uniref:Uncharacterized protein n=1 Tax=Trichonephila clavipes TaxID=2585209 RepID=A0A8X6VHW5_TRICX|nr:uncharacterized protein TNCV_2336031 [Trichonephila clavipes]
MSPYPLSPKKSYRATGLIASKRSRWKGTGEYFPPLQFTCRNCGGGDRGRVAIYRPLGEVSLSLNRTVTCMVLKANDRRTSCPCHNEFRGPRSDYVRQSPNAMEDSPVGRLMHIKFPEAQSPDICLIRKLGEEVLTQALSSSPDHGLKLQSP